MVADFVLRLFVVTGLLACGCGPKDKHESCMPGSVQSCNCQTGPLPTSTQTCMADWTWGDCNCFGGDTDADMDLDMDADMDLDMDSDGDTDTGTDLDADSDSDTDTIDTEDCDRGTWPSSHVINDAGDLAQLAGYTGVQVTLYIQNSDLESLDGLQCLNSVGGNLEIVANENLTSLEALQNLSTISAGLRISNNDALTGVNGLAGISQLESLGINGNGSLTNLDGLQNLTYVSESTPGVSIYDNSSLPQCVACDLLDQLSGFSGSISFHDNEADECNDDCEEDIDAGQGDGGK